MRPRLAGSVLPSEVVAPRAFTHKGANKRAYCLAQVKRDYVYCYRIKDGDRRNQCLAEIKGSRDRCHAIKDQDDRKACLARAR